MWVMMSGSFLSIVEPQTKNTDRLLVRARAKGDIERVFPTALVTSPPGRDYGFRALIYRTEVAQAIAAEVTKIDYGNFKDSVPEQDRHDAYLGCWTAMHRFQIGRQAKRGKQGRLMTEDRFGR